MCIFCVYTVSFSGPNGVILLSFPPPFSFAFMMNLFEGHVLHEQRHGCIFLSLCEMGNIVPEEKCTVKISLVVTHYMFVFLNRSFMS